MKRMIVALVFSLLGASAAWAETLGSDFKALCSLMEEALSLDDPGTMGNYIRDNLKYRVTSKDVIEAYDAIFLVDPHKRYELFKQAAEANMDKSWDCPAFKVLVGSEG